METTMPKYNVPLIRTIRQTWTAGGEAANADLATDLALKLANENIDGTLTTGFYPEWELDEDSADVSEAPWTDDEDGN
jgi:hypothetical protein